MDSTRFEIRRAMKGDEEDIIALVHSVIKHSLSSIYPPSALNWFYEYHSITHLSEEIENGADVFVVYDGAELVGTVTYYADELKRLFIHPDWQKAGIGKQLTEIVEALAKERGKSYITLYANPATWRYYAAKGYEPISFAASEMENGEYLAYCTMVKYLMPKGWSIEKAAISDAAQMLAGQKKAFYAVAKAHTHMDMVPMSETEDEIKHAIEKMIVFVARDHGKIAGSVRGEQIDGACYISRLWVAPEYQGKGLGSALMYAVEDAFSYLDGYKLFTGSETPETIAFYEERGYVQTRREPLRDYELVYMEKMNAKSLIR